MTEEIQPGGLEIRGGGGQRAAASIRVHMRRGRGIRGPRDGRRVRRAHTHTFDLTDLEGLAGVVDVDF